MGSQDDLPALVHRLRVELGRLAGKDEATQEETAEWLSKHRGGRVTQSQVSRWENGEAALASTLFWLRSALADVIAHDTEEKPAPDNHAGTN